MGEHVLSLLFSLLSGNVGARCGVCSLTLALSLFGVFFVLLFIMLFTFT